ncbi:MAG: SIMPL domain-containing protein [Bacteroidota bacterium]
MHRAFVPALLAALLAVPAAAQFTLAAPDTSRVLTVSGFGRAAMDADRAVLTVSFETEGETVDEAIEKHEEEVRRVRQLLQDAGVPESEIKLERVNIGGSGGGMQFEAVRPRGDDDAFTASRTLIVRVDDLDLVPSIMAAAVRNADDDLLDVQRRTVNARYTVASPEGLLNEALRDAVRNARTRAMLITEMSGLELGEILTVVESGASPWNAEARALAMFRDGMGSSLTDGEYVVNAQVVVTFRIQ